MRTPPLAVAALSTLSLAFAQESRRAVDHSDAAPAASAPAAAELFLPGAVLPTVSRNAWLPIGPGLPADVDDGVPLAGRPRVEAGAEGDRWLEAAAGDPFVLSFAAGELRPPSDVRIDPELLNAAAAARIAGRSTTFGFVMFSARMTQARLSRLESMGVRALAFHPQYCMKVAIPIDAIDACAALDFVRWIGVSTPQQKLHPVLTQRLAAAGAAESLDVWINLFDSDASADVEPEVVARAQLWDNGIARETSQVATRTRSGGWQERRIRELGIEIVEYVDSIQAFRAKLSPAQVEALVALDFVQFVEADLPASLAHDESTPMVSNDITRAFTNGANSSSVTVGYVDSGADLTHSDLAGIGGVGWDFSGAGTPFADGCEHGSHVLGTIIGNGAGLASQKGNAPGLARFGGHGRLFMVRKYNDACASNGTPLSTIASVLNVDFFDGAALSPRPVAINNSWGTIGANWIGSEANPRLLDGEVYASGQAWVFAAGNEGYGPNIRQEATAKNVITVGSVDDYEVNGFNPGLQSAFSSTGPCGDSRWKPNLVAPGSWITSVDANSGSSYKGMWGTSMAAPHVTGLIAQLCDVAPWARYRSSAIQTVLMASATTFNNQTLAYPPTFSYEHLNTFGAGRIDGMRALLGTGDSWWNTWTFDQTYNNWNYADFNVPAGTTRVVVCMHYDEVAASAGAGSALVNNWDLHIDQAPIDPAGNNGDYFAQQSPRDNTEIRILDNPTPGAWRWKVWPQSTVVNSTVRMSVTAYFVTGSTTPSMSIVTSATDYYVKPGEHTKIQTQVWNPSSFVASAAYVRIVDMLANIHSARVGLFDGSVADLRNNPQLGRGILLGNLPKSYARNVEWEVSWPTEGNYPWGPSVHGDNFATVANNDVYVTVDGTPPSNPVLFASSHAVGVWSANPTIQFLWNTPGDNLSGVGGYAAGISLDAPADPGSTMNLGEVNGWSTTLQSGARPSYLSVRAVDRSGNWAPSFSTLGPFLVDTAPPAPPNGPSTNLPTNQLVGGQGLVEVFALWGTTPDPESGIAGWGVSFDQNPTFDPTSINVPWISFPSYYTWATATGTYYLHVRACDNAGNWSTTSHAGPFLINVQPDVTYCTAKVNSLGCTPAIDAWGHAVTYQGPPPFTLRADQVRNNKVGLMLYSVTGRASAPFQGGTLCIAAPLRRTGGLNSGGTPTGADCSGVYSIDMNAFAQGTLGGNPSPALLVEGTLVRCQFWGRDPGFPAPNNSTLSAAIEYLVCAY